MLYKLSIKSAHAQTLGICCSSCTSSVGGQGNSSHSPPFGHPWPCPLMWAPQLWAPHHQHGTSSKLCAQMPTHRGVGWTSAGQIRMRQSSTKSGRGFLRKSIGRSAATCSEVGSGKSGRKMFRSRTLLRNRCGDLGSVECLEQFLSVINLDPGQETQLCYRASELGT